jgi:hypothetical protein
MSDFDFTDADVLPCPCHGTGFLGREWLESRDPRCTCYVQSDDFVNLLHTIDCDSIPCPFCPAEKGNDA